MRAACRHPLFATIFCDYFRKPDDARARALARSAMTTKPSSRRVRDDLKKIAT